LDQSKHGLNKNEKDKYKHNIKGVAKVSSRKGGEGHGSGKNLDKECNENS